MSREETTFGAVVDAMEARGQGWPPMSLRDWFAGLAMQGMLSSGDCTHASTPRIAEDAYAMADDMLAQRSVRG